MAENPATHFSVQVIRRERIPEDSIIRLTAYIFQQSDTNMKERHTFGVMFEVTAELPASQKRFHLSREIFGYESAPDALGTGRYPVFTKADAIAHAETGFLLGVDQVLAQHIALMAQAYEKLSEFLREELKRDVEAEEAE